MGGGGAAEAWQIPENADRTVGEGWSGRRSATPLRNPSCPPGVTQIDHPCEVARSG